MNSSVVRVTEALNLAPHQTVIMMMVMVVINTLVFLLNHMASLSN